MGDMTKVSKVTLLEGVPFEKELLGLPYKNKKFDGLFRETKLCILGTPGLVGGIPPAVKNYNGLPARLPPPTAFSSPTPSIRSLIDLPRIPSASTLDGLATVSKTKNWAALVAAPPPIPEKPIAGYGPTNREDVIARNRIGQRIDPVCRDYDKVEVDRVRRIKMCNVHFLRQECPYGNACTHL